MKMGWGNPNARVMVIGEFWQPADEARQQCFSGYTGDAMIKLLRDAGILEGECYFTVVVPARPPYGDAARWIPKSKRQVLPHHVWCIDRSVEPILAEGVIRLGQEIELLKPKVIIACGNLALWALTGADSAEKWRGSLLEYKGIRLIPTFNPQNLMASWASRAPMLRDVQRAARELVSPVPTPVWSFIIRPTLDRVAGVIDGLLARMDGGECCWFDLDIETRGPQIACLGFSYSATEALVIPFMCIERKDGYWSLDEEALIVYQLYKLFTHENARIRWQNGLFDAQFLLRYWHFIPRHGQDTMLSQHTLFAGQKKSLAYQASVYCEHYVYWKDDGKTWAKEVSEEQLWAYNAQDCIRTREVGEVEAKALASMGLADVDAFQQSMFYPVLQAMSRGVRVDQEARAGVAESIRAAISSRQAFLEDVVGHSLNPKSPKQMTTFFYGDLKQQANNTRAKKGKAGHLTCDDEALDKIAKREPILLPVVQAIKEIRSLNVFLATFIEMPVDDFDGRMRCSYNITGTETFRLSSSQNVFGSGGNLQNLPKGDEKGLLPNIRKFFVPDPGMVFFDTDLDRADAQVVAWESEEHELKEALVRGVDLHLLNAYAIQGKEAPPLEWLVEGHAEYDRIRSGMKKERQLAKSWVHGTNYGGTPRTMAIAAGITVRESEEAQKLYFGKYPGIQAWHKRVWESLQHTKMVSNKFGYRRFYFDRVDNLLPEALAWIPQSTVGLYINRVWRKIYEELPEVEVLLQVHDSLAGQFPIEKADYCIEKIKSIARTIVVPYDDPLIIPLGVSTSEVSWGDC